VVVIQSLKQICRRAGPGANYLIHSKTVQIGSMAIISAYLIQIGGLSFILKAEWGMGDLWRRSGLGLPKASGQGAIKHENMNSRTKNPY
jgi:hypothetical protein